MKPTSSVYRSVYRLDYEISWNPKKRIEDAILISSLFLFHIWMKRWETFPPEQCGWGSSMSCSGSWSYWVSTTRKWENFAVAIFQWENVAEWAEKIEKGKRANRKTQKSCNQLKALCEEIMQLMTLKNSLSTRINHPYHHWLYLSFPLNKAEVQGTGKQNKHQPLLCWGGWEIPFCHTNPQAGALVVMSSWEGRGGLDLPGQLMGCPSLWCSTRGMLQLLRLATTSVSASALSLSTSSPTSQP